MTFWMICLALLTTGADDLTLGWLSLLARRGVERSLAVLGTYRSDEAGPALDLLQERSSCRGNELIDGLEDSNVHGVRCQRLDVDAVNRYTVNR